MLCPGIRPAAVTLGAVPGHPPKLGTMQPKETTKQRRRLRIDLTILVVIGLLLVAAVGAGGASLYREFWGPAAFVTRYLDLLADGRAADALHIPGVAIDRDTLDEAGIDATASEALLRSAALGPLTHVKITSQTAVNDVFAITVSYRASGHKGSTTFHVRQDGWTGVTPNWRFTTSPLAIVQLTVRGSDTFAINGFEVDRRQVSAARENAGALDPLPLLVFTPGLYSVTVQTAIAEASGTAVLADTPLAVTPLDVQSAPTDAFVKVVQERVDEFLAKCATQRVLQPTACPFGLEVTNRIASLPKWSITAGPKVKVVPDGGQWQIPTTDAVAHVEVDIQSLFDGSVRTVSEDVPFQVNGTIVILPDGTATIRVGDPSEPTRE